MAVYGCKKKGYGRLVVPELTDVPVRMLKHLDILLRKTAADMLDAQACRLLLFL